MSFLNTKPLIYPILNGELQTEEIDLSVHVPSRLATLLGNKELDIGLIPIVEYFRANDQGKGYRVLPNISIASQGSVLSIQLFSRVPIQEIQHIALDTSSRSSVALLKILLAEKYRLSPTLVPCDPSINPATATEAVLLIGDPALKNLGATEYSIDLGTEWHELTGLPFVYACWVARGDVELGNVPNLLLEAKNRGVTQIPEIARIEAEKLGFPENLCKDYLQHHIHYDLDESEIAGLEHFYKLAVKNGLVESERTLTFAS
ncbi:MAG: menaquinone biosynthesis protein [Candidatus Poribacteria bacterium]|nr:menaquinone biosynthesis protein [Candidatus Poribacteria bacterium]